MIAHVLLKSAGLGIKRSLVSHLFQWVFVFGLWKKVFLPISSVSHYALGRNALHE